VKEKHAAKTWNMLDNLGEENALKRGKLLKKSTQMLKKQPVAHAEKYDKMEEESFVPTTVEEVQAMALKAVKRMTAADIDAIRVLPGYNGPHLNFPLETNDVLNMLEDFKLDRTLHYKYMLRVLMEAKAIFSSEATVQRINLPSSDVDLTIVGDLHGQLQDLFTIFSINGVPSEKKWYLFNGDFVDRGPKGCEIVATLCAFKVLYPNYVFLNRGNHEARAQNAWMGFDEELLGKYNERAESETFSTDATDKLCAIKLHTMFMTTFDSLPLSALIQEKVFVCHGGLFRNDGVTLQHIDAINRKREPPLEGVSFEDRIYEDILWSDPRPTSQYTRPLNGRRASDRGAGCEFGPAVTNQFCANNQVALIVRSHECIPEGFEVLHEGRLITIFSASRYCGTQTNKGAFITFGMDLQPEIQQFYALAVEDEKRFISEEERHKKLVENSIHMIAEQICDKRVDLYWYFTKSDHARTGKVSRVEWSNALTTVLGINLPYLHYQEELADVDADGMINYSAFLSRFQIDMREEDAGWADSVVQRICQKLFALVGADTKKAYQMFDANSDGCVEYDEFVAALSRLDAGLSDQQTYELMRSIDVNNDGHIDFKEFVERFEVIFQSMGEEKDGDGRTVLRRRTSSQGRSQPLDWKRMDAWTAQKLKDISAKIFSAHSSLKGAFAHFDANDEGGFGAAEFRRGLEGIHIHLSEDEARKLFAVVDSNSSGRINVVEFEEAFHVNDNDPRSDQWKQGVVQHIANVLYQHRIHIRAAFRIFDVDGSGTITGNEFRSGMQAVNALLDKPLTEDQIEELRVTLDRDGDGVINYKEFFAGFSVTDTKQSGRGHLMRRHSSSQMYGSTHPKADHAMEVVEESKMQE